MGAKFRHEKDFYVKLAKEYAHGANCTFLAKKYDYSPMHILRIVRDHGVRVRTQAESILGKPNLKKRKFAIAEEEEMCKLYRKGKTEKQIARKYNWTESGVSTVLKRNAVPTRKNLHTGKHGKFVSRWKGGWSRDKCGHIRLQMPFNPRAYIGGYVIRARYLVEQHLGRSLKSNEVVHHINCIPNDDRIENLQVMDKRDHIQLHTKLRSQRN